MSYAGRDTHSEGSFATFQCDGLPQVIAPASVPTLYHSNIERSSSPHHRQPSADSIHETNSPSFNDAQETQQNPRTSTSQSPHNSICPVQHDPAEAYRTIKHHIVYKAFTPLQVDLTEEFQDGKNQFDGSEQTRLSEGIDRDLATRNLSIVALIVGWCTSIAVVAVGVSIIVAGRKPVPEFLVDKMVLMASIDFPFPRTKAKAPLYLENHRVYSMPEAVMILASLLLNVALTLVLDAMNYIPSTTLKWALLREGRLTFNSNPRIFTSSRTHMPNRWYFNAISGVGLVLAYGSTSVLSYEVYVAGTVDSKGMFNGSNVSGDRYGLDFNAWGCIGLGIGLIFQAIISTWCLLSNKMVGTWTSNPLGVAYVCQVAGFDEQSCNEKDNQSPRQADTTRSMSSMPNSFFWKRWRLWVNNSNRPSESLTTTRRPSTSTTCGTTLSRPRKRQLPAYKMVPEVRRMAVFLWFVFLLLCGGVMATGIIAEKTGSTTATFVNHDAFNTDALSYWQTYGQVYARYCRNPFHNRQDWLGLIIQCIVLTLITLGLHCVELVVHVHRDESVWRKATTVGIDPTGSVLWDGTVMWPVWILSIFKSVIHWVFGYAFSANCFFVANLLPLTLLTFLFLLLALFVEILIRYKPKGSQPATYGNIKAIMALVDDWKHQRIYWGDKGEEADGIRRAGTGGQRLADLRANKWYVGLRLPPGYGVKM